MAFNTSKLTAEQLELFNRVHEKHLKTMDPYYKKKYAMENVRKVVWDKKEGCLKVYYDDEWWHYTPNGTWY